MSIERDVLRILMMDRGYVSEAKLAQQIGIPKSVVNSIMRELIAKGFVIDFHPELGYRLADLDNLSQAYKYADYLDTEIKFYINYVEVCDSTQDIALALAKKGAPEGTVVLAEELRRGRGRMGRQWIAARGGLWLSIILRPRIFKHMHLLSLAIATALAEAINNVLRVDTKVKWPNDVLINEKKLQEYL
ncbi:MAG: biotin--[acetyl-CoA-carboxylase] ligase [Ignisphaera sp.]